jgi:GMP synthase (glutamine-hydrolysing)
MTSRTAIAIRHVPFEDLGLAHPQLVAAGFDVAYRDAPLHDPKERAIERADLLIVLGGPIGAYDDDVYPFLRDELGVLERRLSRAQPTLGICLGSQLMARALGARVFAGSQKEIGWGNVELTDAGRASCLGALDGDVPVLHWHGDTFDLPTGAVRLASTALYENQAFEYGRNALALQFHLELEPVRLEQWLVGHAVELGVAGMSIPELRAGTAAVAGRVRDPAERVFASWLRELG